MKKLLSGFLIIYFFCACTNESKKTLFTEISPRHSNVAFNNEVHESEDWNIIKYLYFFNGGGVAVGDVNNDGLPDIAFSANQMPNKLYLNKGGFQFEDVTETANFKGYSGNRSWKTGISMADVNGDGWLDIYVCQVGYYKHILNGRNELFINQQDGTFKEMAKDYGLAFKGFSQQASFFDYDLDGDLDMYLLNHSVHSPESYARGENRTVRDSMSGDRLFRNDGVVFKEVGKEAGIYSGAMGYGLSATISDLDQNGCPDIYVSNDFHENDYLYLNNCDGTFTEAVRESMGHISNFSMGNDIADINNDGWTDILSLDMKPEDEVVLKSSLGVDAPNLYYAKQNYGFHEQQPRNMLQLNRGNNHEVVQFSEIAELSNIPATDWSWSSLMADFDNDGWKDIFITNGIPKRPNDQDYLKFTSNNRSQGLKLPELEITSKMPSGQMPNYAFKNNKGPIPIFEDVSDSWGLNLTGYSHGAAYADFDNDGDLDLVVNNLNAPASLYQNNAEKLDSNNYLKIKILGEGNNQFGIGTRVEIHVGDEVQIQEVSPTRGWQSSVDYVLNFGLEQADKVDMIYAKFPSGGEKVLVDIPANQLLEITQSNPNDKLDKEDSELPLFQEENNKLGIDFIHKENRFSDFDKETLIPHVFSREGPALAVGDVNGDGLEDIYLGGAKAQAGALFIQKSNGSFFQKEVMEAFREDYMLEDVDALFFDADNDEDLDLIVLSGGGEYKEGAPQLQDRLYLNDGDGLFTKNNTGLPEIKTNSACVVTADFNEDGAIDIFLGSRSLPSKYGEIPQSFILLNDGKGNFEDATSSFGSNLSKLGMITDAVWIEEERQLVIVGEWMPITFLKFVEGKIEKTTIPNTEGWWNTIYATDMDGDDDIDILAGNLGLNSNLKASIQEPLELFVKDFDNNGQSDPILTYYRHGKRWTFAGKDALIDQIASLKKRFVKYTAFANSTFSEVFTPDEIQGALHRKAVTFASSYFENKGNNQYEVKALPLATQFAPIQSFLTGDFDEDGYVDVLAVGNFFKNHPTIGPLDASFGNFMKGNGKGGFESIESRECGFYVNGDARALSFLKSKNRKPRILVVKNNKEVQVFEYYL